MDARISQEGPQRVNFVFEAARVEREKGDISVPPFGKGWFENIYVDATWRVAEDSRGDILVTRRG